MKRWRMGPALALGALAAITLAAGCTKQGSGPRTGKVDLSKIDENQVALTVEGMV